MPWGVRWTFVSWANNSVGTQSCLTPLGRSAERSDPTRPWYVRVLDSTSERLNLSVAKIEPSGGSRRGCMLGGAARMACPCRMATSSGEARRRNSSPKVEPPVSRLEIKKKHVLAYFYGHALHEKGLQKQTNVGPLVSSQVQRVLLIHFRPLDNPQTCRTQNLDTLRVCRVRAAHSGVARRAGLGRTGRRRFDPARRQPSLLPSIESKTVSWTCLRKHEQTKTCVNPWKNEIRC